MIGKPLSIFRTASFQGRQGWFFAAATGRGVCLLSFDPPVRGRARLAQKFPGVVFRENEPSLRRLLQRISACLERGEPFPRPRLDPHGTAFQKKVWRALRAIPWGRTRSYAEVARRIGSPGSPRAVGNACARNAIALLIPCHRVVASNGTTGGYAWGVRRKRQLLEAENARRGGR